MLNPLTEPSERVLVGFIPTCDCGAFPVETEMLRYSESHEQLAGCQLRIQVVLQPWVVCPNCGAHWCVTKIEGA